MLALMGLASNCWEVLFVPASLMTAGVIGSVHKSVVGSLTPIKIMFPLYLTTHLVSLNMILHAPHNIFYSKVIDYKCECDGLPFMSPQSQCVAALVIAMGRKPFLEEFVCKYSSLWETPNCVL